ncbi:MAG: hypothetical protein IJS90_05535 [Clostridia bacterium]|nr:hypothetical protein [Clostridia bacterium]
MDDKNTGVGAMKPADAQEWARFTIEVKNGVIESASYECADNATLINCAETLKGIITEKDVTDLFQMNNNAIYYNIEPELKRDELYLASVCVLAAKRAAADWCKKNGAPLPDDDCCCT